MDPIWLVIQDKGGDLGGIFGAYFTLDLASSAATEIGGMVVELAIFEDHRPEP